MSFEHGQIKATWQERQRASKGDRSLSLCSRNENASALSAPRSRGGAACEDCADCSRPFRPALDNSTNLIRRTRFSAVDRAGGGNETPAASASGGASLWRRIG